MIDFPNLWQHVTREFKCDADSIHGPDHWRRVERNGLLIAKSSGAVVDVVRLFALFHDSRREDDGSDDTHGGLGAAYAGMLRGKLFELPQEHFELLQYACTWHTHGKLSENPTIGACWDADRLDLTRIGAALDPNYMSTRLGQQIAYCGSVAAYLSV